MSRAPAEPRRHPTIRHLEQLMVQLLDGVILIDAAGVILSANPAALAMHGVERVEDLGLTAEEYAERFSLRDADGRSLKRRDYPLFRLLAGESLPDMVVEVAPAGEKEARWVHQVRDVVLDIDGGEPDYLALVISDISERFNAEARFRAMFQANPAPAIIVRLRDQKVIQANPGFLSLTGFTAEQLVGRTLFALDLLSGPEALGAVRAALENGTTVPQSEAELRVASGPARLVLFAGQPIDVTDEDALLLTFADLEARRQAEASLAASERHLLAMFEMAPAAMVVTRNADHRIERVNAAFRQLIGQEGEDAVGRTFAELGLWQDGEQQSRVEKTVSEGGRVSNAEAQLSSRTGETIDCLLSAETISMHGADCVLWVLQDVTERRRSEAELGQAIDAVMKDASWLSHSILDKLATLRRPSARPGAVELSRREREILDMICDDLDDVAIANALSISRNTVRNHVARLYAKIGVNRRSAAVLWGRERGMGGTRV